MNSGCLEVFAGSSTILAFHGDPSGGTTKATIEWNDQNGTTL
ncbi:hypothetical protein CRE_07652 [Caenorhabditis remanei]|uniref:Uncharacterized protein n=1 Tax=Caenorhabditis remanei TaxID=31234 RepID=E3MP39_CAERE|nr:hypothetical protein CRE_07652 [Caenorhabditis remanei]